MRNNLLLLIGVLLLNFSAIQAQQTDANLFGDVTSGRDHIPFANVFIEGTNVGTTTDATGHYMLVNLPTGKYTIVAQSMGYKTLKKEIVIKEETTLEVNFELEEDHIAIDDIVVTGTKTFKRLTESAVIVNVLDAKTIQAVQANTLSESLVFQPGLRVETDCQTCNYSQLRINGLGGAYSQILINGRPVFSPLTGLYGLEQIPSNMINRIEVVRGGGSALYGSGAIGGTVNVITQTPVKQSFEINMNNTIINGMANDNLINANVNALSKQRNAGVSFFGSRRYRQSYDHDADGYSELPELRNNSFGFTSFFRPTNHQKIELSFSSLYEYRYGGEITDRPAHEAEQSEERTHNVLMGGLDYQLDFNNNNSAFILYFAGQNTKRDHYTGIVPDTAFTDNNNLPFVDYTDYMSHFLFPPYGVTNNTTYQGGGQLNHKVFDFLGGINNFTLGAEYMYDMVDDEIESYNYVLNQTVHNMGAFLQSDWEVTPGLFLLTGIRMDKHNFLDKAIFSPRISALYRLKNKLQFRASWGTGFKAPQAFDTDMHISFAAGGVSRIRLAPELKEERSNSFTGSVNYDLPKEHFIFGFTVEGFYTKLNDAFALEEAGEDDYGLIFEKRNATSSIVQGGTIELRGNYDKKVQLETGLTLQTSSYQEEISYSADLPGKKEYLRTPNDYGYYTLTFTPNARINASVSGVYTGKMDILHVAGAVNGPASDVYKTTNAFHELNIKAGYTFTLNRINTNLEFYAGVKNLLNNYQDDFDMGKYRDSNYIYGPGLPRNYYFGIKIRSL